jgi:hypothetical protein
MANNLINSGVHLVNSIPNVKQKTLIVMGSPRSGTSMIGKVLYSLGVFKGKIDQAVYEDSKIIEVLENNTREQ